MKYRGKLIRLLPEPFRQRYIINAVKPFTLVGIKRIKCLYQLARKIQSEKIPGDIVECGVFNGGTAAILSCFSTHSRLKRTLWLFDSFKGMPQITENDDPEAKTYVGQVVGDLRKVRLVLKLVDADMDHVRIMKGWFHETFPKANISKIALLHIDADWYESVRLCLEKFYEDVVPGGFIVIDDYGHWSGCKKAVDNFFSDFGLSYKLHSVDYTARWFQKV